METPRRTAPLAFTVLLGLAACGSSGPGSADSEGPAPEGKAASSPEGMVVSQEPLATGVGARVLAEGGNAVDAAVATAFALAVVEPASSGIGGRTQILGRSGDGSFFAIDGTTQVPEAYPADTVVDRDAGTGYGAVGVPGTVAALERALREHGTWSLSRVLEPAIAYAEEGFVLPERQARAFERVADDLRRFEGSRAFLGPDGEPYAPGERFVQEDLARTLRAVAEGGADAFYRGEIARRIHDDMVANGGFVRREDLESYEAPDAVIVRGSYRAHELVGTYLPAAGANTIAILQILETFDLEELAGSPRWAALVAQAALLGFEDRLADLARMGPPETFPSRENAREIVSRERARRRAEEIRWPPPVAELLAERRNGGDRRVAGRFPPGHTTHVSVADAEGGAVALTQSLGPTMGSKVATPGLGFAYASTMGYLSGVARSAGIRRLGPGDRASSRQSPMMVSRDGDLRYVLGGSGARRIVSALVQVVSRSVDEGLPFEEAMAAPRVHVEPADPETLHAEVRSDAAWSGRARRYLRAFGYTVANEHDQSFGNVSGIRVDPDGGGFLGVADPRGAGGAAGPESP